MPCRKHGTPKDPTSWYWNVLGEEHIGLKGPICDRCGARIFVDDPEAQWAALNPSIKPKDPEDPKVYFEGYRIPQLIVPWIVNTPRRWAEFLHAAETWQRWRFFNECLGRSYDSGTRPITQADVMANCIDNLYMRDFLKVPEKYPSVPVYMGIDWGGESETSFTVVVMGGYFPWAPKRFSIFYAKRFIGRDADQEAALEVIEALIDKFNVRLVGSDRGNGGYENTHLIRKYGINRIRRYQWAGSFKHKVAWDPKMGTFIAHRTEVLTDFFAAIKRGDVFGFPCWEDWEDPFSKDMLNIFGEYNEKARRIDYKRGPGGPDDTMHALSFAFLVSMLEKPRRDILTPTKTPEQYHEGYDDLDIALLKEDREEY